MPQNSSPGRTASSRWCWLTGWFNRHRLPYFVLLVLLAFLVTTEYLERRKNSSVTLPVEAGKEAPLSLPVNLAQAPEQVEAAWQTMMGGDHREEPAPTGVPVDPGRFVPPFQGKLRQGLGWRYDEKLNVWSYHRGADFTVNPDGAVMAIAPGEVMEVKPGEEGGLAVTIDHGDGWRSFYERLGRVGVTAGKRVEAGEIVGHPVEGVVHFAVEREGIPVDPLSLFPGLD